MTMVTAKIIIIGNEIVAGKVNDTNGPFLARRLHELGVAVSSWCVIPDQTETLKQAIRESLEDHDIIITSGGLGPTPDDLTKLVVGRLLHRRQVLDETLLARIEAHFARICQPMPATATKQALIPQGAIVLDNPVGLAPGLILVQPDQTTEQRRRPVSAPSTTGRRILILLPGVPVELERIFETGVVPYLEETCFLTPMLTALIRTIGITESEIVERIDNYLSRRKTVQIAYLPSVAGVDISLATERDRKALTECQKEIVARIRPQVYATDRTNLEEVVGELLRQRRSTLSVAESCTGGLVANLITDVPGSSDYFLGGVIAYSNVLKRTHLGVSDEILNRHGAVSRECVVQMACGARERFRSDYALAISGIAGPTGGSATKPVGLVYVGVASPGNATAWELHLAGSRPMIKLQAALRALDFLRQQLTG